MRKLLLLLLLAGVALGIGYPWYTYNFSGAEIGSWRVFDRPGPYKPVTVPLKAGDGPVRAFVDMQPLRNFIPAEGRTALTSVVTLGGRDVLVKTLSYVNAQAANRGSPQGPRFYRDRIGDIDPVESGDYTFKIGPGDVDGLEVAQVDLVLRKGAATVDKRVVPAGLTMIAVAIFFLIRLRRGRKAPSDTVPPAPKWGR
ncbi:hypothetical protein [Phyllobacterium myrsinacearum]|uniref:Uncharacterized protein n=1 Tax=Phyllobacterium myrsinacearum TaxID=28101 RepID=A0A839EDK0_9HYPH|nr:hypothetical protein [Phyllobacterium myrsinacearum]MBA8876508.1 hypothetical protein [Phyllobacterium myrsinacearum]